jgi:hypothetical protein
MRTPQWPNKHLLPLWVDDKRRAPEMRPCLQVLVNHVITLCKGGLEACYCTEELILQWIRPLDRREKLTFECPRFVDPTRNPSSDNTLVFSYLLRFHHRSVMTLCLL